MNNYLYIIDQSKKFEGWCEASMPFVPQEKINETKIHFSDMTFEEYNKECGGNMIAVDKERYFNEYYQPFIESSQTAYKEITEEEWDMNLGCVPPKKWHYYRGIEIFFVGECYFGGLHTCCIRIGDKRYAALRSLFASDEELVKPLI